MFHPGLVQAKGQADRGQAYQEYVRSVLSLPAFVGCHWFQYDNEPLTGRFDGENYNIGMVSGADTPYWELISAAQEIHAEVYTVFAAPRLTAFWQTNRLNLSWPFLPGNYVLETTSTVSPGAAWKPVTNSPALAGVKKTVQLQPGPTSSYFRLRQP